MQVRLFEDDAMMEPIDINQIINEKILDYSSEVIRKYFRKGILYAHKRKRDGITLLSYRGSVIVRLRIKESIISIARARGKRLNIEELGIIFNKVAGDQDVFIVSRLAKKISIGEIEAEFTEAVKKHLNL
jgi:hypothetical protein